MSKIISNKLNIFSGVKVHFQINNDYFVALTRLDKDNIQSVIFLTNANDTERKIIMPLYIKDTSSLYSFDDVYEAVNNYIWNYTGKLSYFKFEWIKLFS